MLGKNLRHRVAVGDIRPHERDARILQRRFEIQQAASVGQLVDDDEAIDGVLERVLNEVGADEPGATGDENCWHSQVRSREVRSEK